MAFDYAECDLCFEGLVTWRLEEMAFRQSSDKGYVHCRVKLSVGTCDKCGSKSLEPRADRIFDTAFNRNTTSFPRPP